MTPKDFIAQVEQITKRKADSWEVRVFTATANRLFPNGLQDNAVKKLLNALSKAV